MWTCNYASSSNAAACSFSTSQLPKVLRERGAFISLTSTCASHRSSVRFLNISTSKSLSSMRCVYPFDFERCFAPPRRALLQHLDFQKRSGHVTSKHTSCHNCMQLFISHLPRWLRASRFSEPTLRPSGATEDWKNTALGNFSTLIRHLHLLSSDFFFL